VKYRLGSLTVEAIDTFVRVSVANVGGIGARARVAVTKREFPTPEEVVALVTELTEARGHRPDNAVLGVCSRASRDALDNKIELALTRDTDEEARQ